MKKALIILQMIPALIEVIKAVESALPEGGKGKEKLALVKDMLSEAYGGINEVWPALEKIVARFVEFANAMGLFKKAA